jgi:hypothetical protein
MDLIEDRARDSKNIFRFVGAVMEITAPYNYRSTTIATPDFIIFRRERRNLLYST